MEQLKVAGFDLTKLCRLCLSHDVSKADIFLFSYDLGKKIADIIMECVPVQVTRYDNKPTYICPLCFDQLKKCHQFQLQVVQSDKKLQRYLQQLGDCDTQVKIEGVLEEQSDNSLDQNSSNIASIKCEPFEIIGDSFYSKHKAPANLINEEISLKSEIKNEPMDNNSLLLTEADDTVENSVIEIGCSKVGVDAPGNVEYFPKFENDMTEKSEEETYNIPLKEADNSLHSENVKDVECFSSNEDINRTNTEFHVSGKLYQCDVCELCFKRAGYLKIHKLIHTGEKPYQCEICEMCFRQVGHLQTHKLKHIEEKPYQCKICKMRFKQLRHLKNHNLIHTGEKPYQCDICKMCFRQVGNLQIHKLKHTGEKPYQCETCKMCFREARSLKDHNLKHTGEKPYKCDICKLCFRHSNSLRRHKLKHLG